MRAHRLSLALLVILSGTAGEALAQRAPAWTAFMGDTHASQHPQTASTQDAAGATGTALVDVNTLRVVRAGTEPTTTPPWTPTPAFGTPVLGAQATDADDSLHAAPQVDPRADATPRTDTATAAPLGQSVQQDSVEPDADLPATQASTPVETTGDASSLVGGPWLDAAKAAAADDADLLQAVETTGEALAAQLEKAHAQGADQLIWVNLPAYRLRVIDTATATVLLESRVIVGKPSTPTPRMTTRVVNLKFNPDWAPPKSIRGARYTPPGPKNPLGQVRFSTDNALSIYLHDTNQHALFDQASRARSHGCVRVQDWRALAALLAGEDEAWVDAQVEGNKTHYQALAGVPVWLDYRLVDFNDDGALVRLKDIYGRGDTGGAAGGP